MRTAFVALLLLIAWPAHPAPRMTCAQIRAYGYSIDQMKSLASRFGYTVTDEDWAFAERCLAHKRKFHRGHRK